MTLSPRLALVTACAVALACVAAPGHAQKKPARSGKKPIVVSSSHVEHALAGVRLGAKFKTILAKFGQPSETVPGGGSASGTSDSAFGGAAAASPFGGTGAFPTTTASSSALPMPGGPPMPGGSSMPMPGATSGGDFSNGTGTDTSAPVPTVTYVYHNFLKHKGFDMSIQLDEDGRVVQIIGTSLKHVPGVSTARGIGFGSPYKAVVDRYNWPESTTSVQLANGTFLQTSFQERAHVAFQFLQSKVVRIVIAEVD